MHLVLSSNLGVDWSSRLSFVHPGMQKCNIVINFWRFQVLDSWHIQTTLNDNSMSKWRVVILSKEQRWVWILFQWSYILICEHLINDDLGASGTTLHYHVTLNALQRIEPILLLSFEVGVSGGVIGRRIEHNVAAVCVLHTKYLRPNPLSFLPESVGN